MLMAARDTYVVEARKAGSAEDAAWHPIHHSTGMAEALDVADALHNFSYLFDGRFEIRVSTEPGRKE